MQRTKVQSSNVAAVGYDAQTQTLEVEYIGKPGQVNPVYTYANVPPTLHKELMQSASLGSFLHRHIKGLYQSLQIK